MKPRTSASDIARALRALVLTGRSAADMNGVLAQSRKRGKGFPGRWCRYIGTMTQSGAPADGGTLFEAVIIPHRSLSPRGLRILIAAIVLLSGLIVLRFWLIGAWPVAGFGVIEVGLAVFLLRLNARRARASELLLLSHDALRIVRTGRAARRDERVLPVGWLNVVLDEQAGRVPKLMLVARGVREEIAAALGEDEKRDLSLALRSALHAVRNPRFDNPQLRDG
jgi:uncharacterized membrane protein